MKPVCQKVKLVKVQNQDYTDVQKCLEYVLENADSSLSSSDFQPSRASLPKVICYGAFGGRFDQELMAINTLFLVQSCSQFAIRSLMILLFAQLSIENIFLVALLFSLKVIQFACLLIVCLTFA